MQSKYFSKKTVYNGETYDSAKEARRAAELNLLLLAGRIQDLRRQVTFELLPAQNGERAVKYTADFVYTENGQMVVEDVKSEATRRIRDYVIKRKLFKFRYPGYDFREV